MYKTIMNVTQYLYSGCQWWMLYTHIQNRNSDFTGVSVGHANTHRYGKNYFLCSWYIKGLHTNCRLAGCFVSYVKWTPEWLSWHYMIYVLWIAVRWIHCSLADSLTDDQFAKLCCLINAFCIAGGTLVHDWRFPHCWPSVWCLHLFQSSSQKSRSFDVFFPVCPNKLLNKQWICKWVEKIHETKIMLLLCNLSFSN